MNYKVITIFNSFCCKENFELFPFRPQTGKVANVILDGADDDDDADEFLVEEKPKDALELEMEPRPASSTNLANVSYVHQHFLNLSDYYNYTCGR